MKRPNVDVFFSYRSPYSYLAIKRLADWATDENIDLSIRPVLPLAIRNPEFFHNANPMMPRYVRNDAERVAQYFGIAFRWPNPDPVVMSFDPIHIAEEQPYIHRLTRLAIAAEIRGLLVPFCLEVSNLIWSGVESNWAEKDHLAAAIARAGLDLSQMDRAITSDPELYDSAIAKNQQDHQMSGHWGVPTMVFNGEPFFGQDRIELLKWRVKADQS